MVSHTPAKLDGDRHRGSGNIMVLVCHVMPQDNKPIRVNYDPAKFGGQSHSGSRDMC